MSKVEKILFVAVTAMLSVSSYCAEAGVSFLGQSGSVSGEKPANDTVKAGFKCPSGLTMYAGQCVTQCDRSVYVYSKTSTANPYEVKRGEIKTCSDPWGTYFYYTSCNEGWELQSKYCAVSSCNGYVYDTMPIEAAGNIDKCKRGDNWVYKYTSCINGWDYSNGKCDNHDCPVATYPFSSSPSSEQGTIKSCKAGAITLYGFTSCNDGWDKNEGRCTVHVCNTTTFPYTYSPGNTAGTLATCKTGSDTLYGYATCNNGWYKSGSYCIENECAGYNSASTSIVGCQTTSSCQKGTSTVYKCDTCYTGYIKSGDNLCVITCAFTVASLPANCSAASNCVRGDANGNKTYYTTTCATCNAGWENNRGTCIENPCVGYNSASANITGCKTTASCQKKGSTVYQCKECYTGYSKNASNTCDKTCTFTATSRPANCAAAASCQLESSSGTTTYFSNQCTTCNPGFYMNDGACSTENCSGYNNTSASITGCKTTASCNKGGTTYYQCTECYTGYTKNTNNTCDKTCNLTATSKPANCTTAAASCDVGSAGGTTTYYSSKCMVCATGYYLKSGACTSCQWDGATLTACQAGKSCSKSYCGGVTKFKVNE